MFPSVACKDWSASNSDWLCKVAAERQRHLQLEMPRQKTDYANCVARLRAVVSGIIHLSQGRAYACVFQPSHEVLHTCEASTTHGQKPAYSVEEVCLRTYTNKSGRRCWALLALNQSSAVT
jgi:hypothetical protein